MGAYRRLDFDPSAHEAALTALIRALAAAPSSVWTDRALHKLTLQHPKAPGEVFSKQELIFGIRALAPAMGLAPEALVQQLRRRPVRSHSGVSVITVLTKPAPCPGRCLFCPSDRKMPKSYLSQEPGAQRAAQHAFDPFAQTRARLRVLARSGHPIDKVELIILGGSFTAYSKAYHRGFVKRCFDALNAPLSPEELRSAPRAEPTPLPEPRSGGSYNRAVAEAFPERPEESASLEALFEAHRQNEAAPFRAVGLVVETRPELLTPAELRHLRQLGVTKIQIGVQSLDEAILKANLRDHSVEEAALAFRRLRAHGFKIQAHWMANLLNATPGSDRADYRRLFEDPRFRPDELKLYPCALIETAPLMQAYQNGRWAPYDEATLLALVADCLLETPVYCRLSRVIRDFSAGDIVVGSRRSNLRQDAETRLRQAGQRPRDIRSREIRRQSLGALRLRPEVYQTAGSEEHFLEFVDARDQIAGFLRLSLPKAPFEGPEELADAALLRELHVYGEVAGFQGGAEVNAQHQGLGRRLVEAAKLRAQAAGYSKLSVISSVGTRLYYAKLGFARGELYQHLALDPL